MGRLATVPIDFRPARPVSGAKPAPGDHALVRAADPFPTLREINRVGKEKPRTDPDCESSFVGLRLFECFKIPNKTHCICWITAKLLIFPEGLLKCAPTLGKKITLPP